MVLQIHLPERNAVRWTAAAGINPTLRAAAGWLFSWKTLLLVAIVLLSIRYYRPFCKYLCPLGALYGLFNPPPP